MKDEYLVLVGTQVEIRLIINNYSVYNVLSVETILSTYPHTQTHTHEHTGYTKLNLHNLKRAANILNRDF